MYMPDGEAPMDEELERLEGIVNALELKVRELDKDDISEEETTQIRAELDDAYEQIDRSDLSDDAVDDLMDRLDDLQDTFEDLVGASDWDDDDEDEAEDEEDDEEDESEEDDEDEDE
jgi:hypothetical protein